MKFEIPISFTEDIKPGIKYYFTMISVTKNELKGCYIVELSLTPYVEIGGEAQKTPFVTNTQKEAYKCVRRYTNE